LLRDERGQGEKEGDKETRGEGDKEGMGRVKNYQCPIPNAQCPMPNAQCPMSNSQFYLFAINCN